MIIVGFPGQNVEVKVVQTGYIDKHGELHIVDDEDELEDVNQVIFAMIVSGVNQVIFAMIVSDVNQVIFA